MRFKGQLLIPAEQGPGLPVDLEVADRHLALVSESERLGTWPLDTVKVRRIEGDIFAMTVAGEDLHFVADDTISFAYDGIQAIEQTRHRNRMPLRGLRSLLGIERTDPEPTPSDAHATTSGTATTGTPPGGVIEPKTDELVEDQPEVDTEDEVLSPQPPPDFGRATFRPVRQWPEEEGIYDIELEDWVSLPAEERRPGLESQNARIEPVSHPAAQSRSDPTHTESDEKRCRALRNDGRPCESPIVGSSGFCYPHDPENPVGRVFQDATEAMIRLKKKRTERLGRVYSRLDRALKQVERGEIDTDQAMAMAQLARTMCAILELGDGSDSASDDGKLFFT